MRKFCKVIIINILVTLTFWGHFATLRPKKKEILLQQY